MNDKAFENYQKRMLDAMQNPNKQSNDLFTKLSYILENLKIFVNAGTYISELQSMIKPISTQVAFARLEFFIAFTSKSSQYILFLLLLLQL